MESLVSSYQLDPAARKSLFLNNPGSFAQGVWDKLRETFPESERQGCSIMVDRNTIKVSDLKRGMEAHISFVAGLEEPLVSVTMAIDTRAAKLSIDHGAVFPEEPLMKALRKIAQIVAEVMKK